MANIHDDTSAADQWSFHVDCLMARLDAIETRLEVQPTRDAHSRPQFPPDNDSFVYDDTVTNFTFENLGTRPRRQLENGEGLRFSRYTESSPLGFNHSRVPDTGSWRDTFVGHHRRTYGRPPPHVTGEDQRLLQRQPPQFFSWDRPLSRLQLDDEDYEVPCRPPPVSTWDRPLPHHQPASCWDRPPVRPHRVYDQAFRVARQPTCWDPPPHRQRSEPATCWDRPTANFQPEHSDFPRQQTVGTRFPMMIDQGGRRSRTDEVELPRSNYQSRIAECRPQQPSYWDRPTARYSTDVKAELLDAEAELPVAEAELPYAEAEAELHAAAEPHAIKAELHGEVPKCSMELVDEVLTRADQPRIVAEALQRRMIEEAFTFVSSAPVVLQKPLFIVHVGCGIGGSSKLQPLRALIACKNEVNYQSQSDWVGSMESIWFHKHIRRRVLDPGGYILPPFLLSFTSPRCSWFVATWYPP